MKESYYTSNDWHNVTELYGEGGEKNVVPVKFNDVNKFLGKSRLSPANE
jgi:hypothetical protein